MSNQVKGWKKGLLVLSTLSMLAQPVMAQQYLLRVPMAGISSQSSGTLEITPSPIVFQGSTPVATAASPMTVNVSNNSFTAVKNVAVTLASGGTDFTQSSDCPAEMPGRTSCKVTVGFKPGSPGERLGSIAISSNAANGLQMAQIRGSAVVPSATLHADNFPSVQLQQTSSAAVTLTNTGDSSITVTPTALAAPFSVSSTTCSGPLAAGASCTYQLNFTPVTAGTHTRDWELGLMVGTYAFSRSVPLSGVGLSQPQVSLSANALTFGSLNVGTASTAQSVTLTNSGSQPMTLTAPPVVTGSSAFVATSSCSDTLEVGQSCSTSVVFTPSSVGSNNAVLSFATNAPNSPSQVSLSGTGLQAVGSLSANSSTDFGTLSLNTTSTRSFTFTNTGNMTATGVNAALVTGSQMTMTANTCGTSAAPVSISAGSSCSMTLTWTPTTDSSAAGSTLTVSGAFNGGSKSLNLTGTGGSFDAAAAWSSAANTITALTAATNNIGVMTSGVTTATKTFYLNNTGTYGALAAGFTLSGDTGQFKISNVYKTTTGGSFASCGSTITGGLTATTCTSDKKNGGSYPVLRVDVQYAPTVTGAHSVTLTPISGNGAVMPAPITLTGSSVYDPTGAWSSSVSSTVALTAANTAFGAMTTGVTTTYKYFYVRNVGTHGSLSESFQLSGDTTQFKITQVCTTNTMYQGTCVYPNSASSSSLTASDVFSSGYPHLLILVQYAPTIEGSHSVTLTPVSGNGYPAPAPITLTGSSVYDPSGVWSSAPGSTVALTAANTAFGAMTTGVTTATKTFYVRNVGTHGSLSESFQLSGDTTQFKISSVCTTNQSYQGTCVYPNSASSSSLTASDVFSNGYPHLLVTVQYAPTADGSHSVTLTPASGNGYPAPAPITLTGSSVYDSAGVWSSAPGSTVALTAANTAFGSMTSGVTTATRTFYVRNVGTHGSLSESFQLSGDTTQFKITQVCANHVVVDSYTTGCVSPNSSVSSNVTAQDVFTGSYSSLRVTVQYAPTASGNHSVTLTPVSGNGYPAPAPITLTGSSTLAALTVTSTSDSFGNVAKGTTAVSDVHTLTNTGTAPAAGIAFAVPTNFAITDSTCSASLAVDASCTFTVSFTPPLSAYYAGTIYISTTSAPQKATIAVNGSGPSGVGQAEYTTPGTYTWVAPQGVTTVSVVAVGAGGGTRSDVAGGGGGLGYRNNIAVTPGQSYQVVVGSNSTSIGGDSYFVSSLTVKGGGAQNATGGTFVGDGGGSGGNGAGGGVYQPTGGGGAGGYSGNGGNGGAGVNGYAGTGGGGGGGTYDGWSRNGGCVGIYGEGTSGAGGIYNSSGSGGAGSFVSGRACAGSGGSGGGAGGGGFAAGSGAVRIIWGEGRAFPSTLTTDQ